MKFRDNLGWPVVSFKARPVTNFLRLLIHTSLAQTWRLRNRQAEIIVGTSPYVTAHAKQQEGA